MPLIQQSTYKPPRFWSNTHIQTIYAAMFRKIEGLHYIRERVTTPDQDFIDLDWAFTGARKLLIVLHGLEGNASRPYVQALIKHANQDGWDGLGMNYRGCSGEPNRLFKSYHCGATADLDYIIQHIIQKDKYREIAIAGFSLGGNITLKYIGEQGSNLPAVVKKAVGVSVPCDLVESNKRIEQWDNMLYLKSFMDSLRVKTAAKQARFPDAMDYEALKKAVKFRDFDDLYTAPAHGFKDAIDYWTQASSLPFLANINIPTLLVNAKDDTFLSETSYPIEIADKNPNLYLEMPENGGHVGFLDFTNNDLYWSEKRVLDFINA